MIRRALRNTMSAEMLSSCFMLIVVALLAHFGVRFTHEWQLVIGLPLTIAVYFWIRRH
jgi:low affinity Fe/Cu permease